MHILDKKRFLEVLKAKGYRSIGDFAGAIGVHRNSIHHYLSGNGVFPEVIEKILSTLNVKPFDIIKQKEVAQKVDLEAVASLIDELNSHFPNCTFVLFGSRAKGIASKYSDWDIGVYAKDGLPHAKYRDIVMLKDEFIEDEPFLVDIVNLNRADDDFMRDISRNWQFLSGRLSDWIDLQRKAA